MTAIGGLIAAIVANMALASLMARGLAPGLVFYALALLLVALGLGLPWLLVEALWRRTCRRHDWRR